MTREAFNSILERFLRRWLGKVVVVVLLLAAARSSVGDWSIVPSTSMSPVIVPGDRIYVDKLAYDLKVPFTSRRLATWGDPQRGDVIVLLSPADGIPLVKRVAGVPGDLVPGADGGERVPPGKYFVAGDNREHSVDSRSFGLVDRSLVLGRATRVIISFDPNGGPSPRRDRIFASLH